ncbi:MAG: type III-A CRISPR-associated RAMP protein Csm4 [Lewinellaceae bacterium]|nr:type III-A CRISPR-associated RAMP protein Csm4 [Phaeodactylibacter sp.]MCB9041488.1 type III-A CRISPR-associated RAMP protein Csm4 [Lewinellaceae bacterium]
MSRLSFITYRLSFTTPLHIGDIRPEDYGTTERFLRSDTLHAALMACWAKLGEPIPDSGDPGFFISSLFPFATVEDEPVYFFPKLMKPFDLGDGPIGYAKKLKRLQWLDQHYFECQLNNISVNGFGGENQPHLTGSFACREKAGEFITSQVSQRVTIPRQREKDNEPVPFYMERLYFKKGAGLYFLFQGDSTAARKLEKALNLLQYEGLGTDRTVGNGAFCFTKGTIGLDVPDSSPHSANLSLFCPESSRQMESMLGQGAAYDFLKRGGWITTEGAQTIRKRAVYMFKEGSIFQMDQPTAGRAAIDLSPTEDFMQLGHKIWRNGSSIFLPVKT